MASILALDNLTGLTNANYLNLPTGVVDGSTIIFKTVAGQFLLGLAPNGIQLQHLAPSLAAQVTAQSTVSIPGTIIEKEGVTPPPGTLVCNGQAVSRTQYTGLFAEIGTTNGSGDGNSTFNLPNRGGNFFIKF